jgi:glycosyltransferase involved in cell wall biosynthesis
MNLLGQYALDKDLNVLAPLAAQTSMFTGLNPLHYTLIEQIMRKKWGYTDECLWIDCVGNDFKAQSVNEAHGRIGRVIVEKPDIHVGAGGLDSYHHLLTGSRWCAELIEELTGREAKVIHEGIDPSLFLPQPKSGWLGPTFNIYSAGKLEYRKGQDLVLRAFKIFHERHGEARLITLWNSPFSDLGNGYRGTLEKPIWMGANGFLDVKGWARDNGIDPGAVMELGCVPNWMLPNVLKEMDCALFPTRIESCTSMPLMESMACGVPVIAPDHSGLRDIVNEANCLILHAYKPIEASTEYFFPRSDCEWYECDIDEMVSALEEVYQDGYREKAYRASEWIRSERTWAIHARKLKSWLLEVDQCKADTHSPLALDAQFGLKADKSETKPDLGVPAQGGL